MGILKQRERVKASFEVCGVYLYNVPLSFLDAKLTLSLKKQPKVRVASIKESLSEKGVVFFRESMTVQSSLKKNEAGSWDHKLVYLSVKKGVKKLGNVTIPLESCADDGSQHDFDLPLSTKSDKMSDYLPMIHFSVKAKWLKAYTKPSRSDSNASEQMPMGADFIRVPKAVPHEPSSSFSSSMPSTPSPTHHIDEKKETPYADVAAPTPAPPSPSLPPVISSTTPSTPLSAPAPNSLSALLPVPTALDDVQDSTPHPAEPATDIVEEIALPSNSLPSIPPISALPSPQLSSLPVAVGSSGGDSELSEPDEDETFSSEESLLDTTFASAEEDATKKSVASLQQQLEASAVEVASLKRAVESFNAAVPRFEKMVEDNERLQGLVTSYSTEVTILKSRVRTVENLNDTVNRKLQQNTEAFEAYNKNRNYMQMIIVFLVAVVAVLLATKMF